MKKARIIFRVLLITLFLFPLAHFATTRPVLANAGDIERVSLNNSELPGNGTSIHPSVSADGRFIAFSSFAFNLVMGDTNGLMDVFVRDRITGETKLVSINSNGVQGNGVSKEPVISSNGRFIAYESEANNLVPGDANSSMDVFVYDLETGETKLVSINSNGVQGNNFSLDPTMSGDGHLVSYSSISDNLVLGDNNGNMDVFIHDQLTGETKLVSVDNSGQQGNGWSNGQFLSEDGHFIVFHSDANNLVYNDNNGYLDVFLRDLSNGKTTLVSSNKNGLSANERSSSPTLSADGRFVAFESSASDLVLGDINNRTDVFVYDQVTSETTLVSVNSYGVQGAGPGGSNYPVLSADGRFVAFQSDASNLVPGETFHSSSDIFVYDRAIGETTSMTIGSWAPQNGNSYIPVLTADGRYVVFESSEELVPPPGETSIYLFDRGPIQPAPTNTAPTANAGADQSVTKNTQVFLNGSGSFDLDQDSLTYIWSENAQNPVLGLLSNPYSISPSFTPPNSGTYTFSLVVNDGEDNSTPDSVTINVLTPSQALENLIHLVESFSLQKGLDSSLNSKLSAAVNTLNDNHKSNDIAAVNSLHSFIMMIDKQRGNGITDTQADKLIITAQLIVNSLTPHN